MPHFIKIPFDMRNGKLILPEHIDGDPGPDIRMDWRTPCARECTEGTEICKAVFSSLMSHHCLQSGLYQIQLALVRIAADFWKSTQMKAERFGGKFRKQFRNL